jgi:hypothetical protein
LYVPLPVTVPPAPAEALMTYVVGAVIVHCANNVWLAVKVIVLLLVICVPPLAAVNHPLNVNPVLLIVGNT